MKYSYRLRTPNTHWHRFIADVVTGGNGIVFLGLCATWLVLFGYESWSASSFSRERIILQAGGNVSIFTLFVLFFLFTGFTVYRRRLVAKTSKETGCLAVDIDVDASAVRLSWLHRTSILDWNGLERWEATDSSLRLDFADYRFNIQKGDVGVNNFEQTVLFLKQRAKLTSESRKLGTT